MMRHSRRIPTFYLVERTSCAFSQQVGRRRLHRVAYLLKSSNSRLLGSLPPKPSVLAVDQERNPVSVTARSAPHQKVSGTR